MLGHIQRCREHRGWCTSRNGMLLTTGLYSVYIVCNRLLSKFELFYLLKVGASMYYCIFRELLVKTTLHKCYLDVKISPWVFQKFKSTQYEVWFNRV